MFPARSLVRPHAVLRPWPVLARALHRSPPQLAHRTSSPSRSTGCTRSLTAQDALHTDYFDSADYVHRFEQHGLTRKQAEGVVDALEGIVAESMDNLESNLVTRTEHYKVRTARLGRPNKARRFADLSCLRLDQHHDRQKVHQSLSQMSI